MSDEPACAHLVVRWMTEEEDGLTTGWWQCRDCASLFTPMMAAAHASRIALDERDDEIAALRRQLEEVHELLAKGEALREEYKLRLALLHARISELEGR